ncbi:hypothetical protein E4T66_13545 [Sinimarinibacterium sp. CAU 1509]|uniref:protein kinase domain-containing protein n=1 Tax=Sinimarinibacterium sp. CAU 1509 TaxID=2562283 RepID=UPI0010AB8903|nr:winged helix-turn-helix domain-containing protein [Sinimarinibacterium sp. CAU 1509]TJY59413.1 hypothetical protein E4T66_13545 [Sinimarinibacterium sp. CAU 1509]
MSDAHHHHAADAAANEIAADATKPAGRLRWQFGAAVLDETSMELRVDGSAVSLEPKPLELLMFLLRRVGEVVTREEILEGLWPTRVVSDSVVTNCVAKLRTALADHDQTLVRTVPRFGYRLVADVKRLVPSNSLVPVNTLKLKVGAAVPGRADWRLDRQLSSGAHGEVWLAVRDAASEQRVIKFARDVDGLSALKREITLGRVLMQSLGDHDQFVRILDWNVEEPPYFLETAYSALGNLEDWCNAQGGVAAVPLEARIEIAAQCAAALAAAHSVGVLHKDVKPSNVIMVANDAAAQPNACLCDFAAGRALDPERFKHLGITQLGFTHTAFEPGLSGTPLYLAPEVMAGQPATVAADIYALGVLLFQLVVGDFRRVPAPGWEQQVADPLLREDIALAAAGDPLTRLADAKQLAVRLRRLDARRVDWTREQQRAAEAERTQIALERAQARRSLLLGLAATFALGAVLSAALYLRAESARRDAATQAAAARATADFLIDDLLTSADPRASGTPNLRVRDLLDVGAERLAKRFSEQPLTRARLQKVIGSAYGTLGAMNKAEAQLLQSEQTFAQLLGPAARETQDVRVALREAYRIPMRFDKMGEVSRRIRDAEVAAGRPNPDMWYEGEWGLHFADCIAQAGAMWLTDCSGRIVELVQQARTELGPDDPTIARMLWVASVLKDISGNAGDAEPLAAEAVERMRRIYEPDNPRLAEARLQWAQSLAQSGQAERGIALFQSVVDSLMGTVGADHPFFVTARVYLGRALTFLGRYDEAIPLLDGSYRWRVSFYGPTSLPTVQGLVPLIEALSANGRSQEALVLLRTATARIDAAGRSDDIEALRIRVMLADTLRATGKDAEAGTLLAANLEDARRRFTQGQWYLGYIAARDGQWRYDHGEREAGLKLMREGATIIAAALGPDDVRTRAEQNLLKRLDPPEKPAAVAPRTR